ncbi:hypothetical protein F0U44_18050 [Nocardioides humilatus]|uniref:PASTA domain-containing protein n=1 Tax=Nocardioides humilatus TaxID=2607660 RepID=A0A5B1L911_9ACTN|nr:hypothetical protein [Nocardioides humilatus]KAA1417075.1 hypothetical protein F0U44_18050 [Nocardioides humilatus]
MRYAVAVVSALLFVSACGSSDDKDAATAAETVTDTATVTATATATETTTVTVTPEPPALPPYPKGFPKKVRVSEVPFPINSEFEGQTFAVAVAPGVWTRLAPGTTVQEAADFGTFTGYCSSISAFEKKYKPEPRGNSCW